MHPLTPRILFSALLSCALVTDCFANAGVFSGNGQTLELATQQQVQMVSEMITITPGRGPNLFNGGTAGADRVDFSCLFTLRNLTAETVTARVGFPLDAEDSVHNSTAPRTTIELIAAYRFIAQDEQGIYNVTYTPGDRHKKLRHLFLWDMNFAPGEEKTLRIDYTMPISMGLVDAVKTSRSKPYTKTWYSELEGALVEEFGYVTITGASWAGTIEKAEFIVEAGRFDDYLAHRPLVETNDPAEKARTLSRIPIEHPTVLRLYSPEGWQTDTDGNHRLVHADYVPTENLRFRYYLLLFPRTVAELEKVLPRLNRSPWSGEDYTDLRDIFREYNGEKTGNPRLSEFLENQLWHGRPVQNPVPTAVIEHLSRLIDTTPSAP